MANLTKRSKVKRRTTNRNVAESLKDKYSKIEKLYAGEYINEVSDLSDNDILDCIAVHNSPLPISDKNGIVCDSCQCQTDTVTQQYNGPIPLGFRTVPPSHVMAFKGPFGKAFRHFGARNFYLGDQLNAWLDQNCFVNKADSMPGEDAVAAEYSFKVHGKQDKKLCDTLELMFHMEHFNLDQTLREFDHHKRCFGAALMVPCFEEDVDMSVPFTDWSILKGKTFLGWTNIEPYYLSPSFTSGGRETNDPTYKFYMVPSYWNVYGSNDANTAIKAIHRSWIFFRRNVVTSKIYQPQYKWQGPSIPQMILERLYSAEVCANESSMLLRSKRSFIMEADLRKLAANPEFARKFLKNCAANSDNYGVKIVPRNSNARQLDSYLSECMPLTTAQYGILCAEISIPAPKFMMAQLTGFANSGNYEVKLYVQKERQLQLDEMVPIVKQTCKIATACETGKSIDFDVEFGDVDVPTVTERSEIMYEEARASKFLEEARAYRTGKKAPGTHHGTKEDIKNGIAESNDES